MVDGCIAPRWRNTSETRTAILEADLTPKDASKPLFRNPRRSIHQIFIYFFDFFGRAAPRASSLG